MSLPIEPPCFNQVITSSLRSCTTATTKLLDGVSSLPKGWYSTGCEEGEPEHTIVVLLHQAFLCSRYAIDACSRNDLYSMALLIRAILGFHHNYFYLVLPQTDNVHYAHHKTYVIHGLMKALYIHGETRPSKDDIVVQERIKLEEEVEKHAVIFKDRCSEFIANECTTLIPETPQLVQWVYDDFESLRDKYVKSEQFVDDLDAFATRREGLVYRGERDINRYFEVTLPGAKRSPSGPLYKFLSTYHHPSYFAQTFTPANRDTFMAQMLQSVAEMTYFMAIASHAKYFSKLEFPTKTVNEAYHAAIGTFAPYMNSIS
jgi:hypothetical protein